MAEKGIRPMTEDEKYAQVRREALATGAGLVVLIGFWLFSGFGLYAWLGSEEGLFHLPVWVLASGLGMCLTALLVVWVLRTFVFLDMDLEEDERG